MKDIEKLREILNERLNEDNGARVREQLSICEAWSARISWMYRLALSELYEARRKALMPKGKDYTELDRTTLLAAHTREYQQTADELKEVRKVKIEELELILNGYGWGEGEEAANFIIKDRIAELEKGK